MTTAHNDSAFWPAPHTAEHEFNCYNKSVKDQKDNASYFIEFSADACQKDGNVPPFDDSGHNCAFKTNVETPYVFAFIKLYGQMNGDKNSMCYKIVNDSDNILKDSRIEK